MAKMASILDKVSGDFKKFFSAHTTAKSESEQTKALNSRLDEMADAAFSSSAQLHDIYQDGLNYLYGNQWENKELKGGFEHVVSNYIYPATMQELAIISQRNSTISAIPWEATDKPGAEVWQGYFRHIWKREWKMDEFLLRAALDGKIYGHYVAYVYWEPRKEWNHTLNRWEGGPKIKLVSPEYFGSDPETDTIDNGEYIVTRRRIPREKAKLMWPKHAEFIDKSNPDDNDDHWFNKSSLSLNSLAFSDASERTSSLDSALLSQRRLTDLLRGSRSYQYGQNLEVSRKWITVEQFWFKDWELEKRKGSERISRDELLQNGAIREGSEDELGADFLISNGEMLADANHPTRETVSEIPRFPTYRFVVRLNNRILNDKVSQQVWPYRRQPFIVGVNQLLPHVWFGMNAVEMPRGMQDMTNITMAHLLDYVKYMSDPTWKMEENTLVKGKPLKGGSGNIIVTKNGKLGAVERLNPANLGSGTKAVLDIATRETQNQTGVHEVATGRQAKGSATATEITLLQTNTKLRMALSNKLLDSMTIKVFETLGEIAQRKLKPEQMIRIVGEKNASTVAKILPEMGFTKFDIELQVTTSLPFDKEKRRQDAGTVFSALGMPALKVFVDAYSEVIDDPEDFIKNVEAYQQLIQLKEQAEAELAASQEAQGQQGLPQASQGPR